MRMGNRGYPVLEVLALVVAGLLFVLLACSPSIATPTPPVAPVTTVLPKATTPPTAVPSPTATPIPTIAVAVTEKPRYGGTLRFPITQSVDAPDPAFSASAGTRRILNLVFNTLVEQTPEGTLGPALAKSWDISSDGKVITFTLQSGIKFHDGTDLDAQAVKWNYDRFIDPKVGSVRKAELTPPLELVEVVNNSTVRFRLAEPFRPILAALSLQAGMIASPTAVQKQNSYANRLGDFGRNPVGSGSFKMKEWVPGSHFKVVRNDGYWEKGRPYLDAMNMPIIGDKDIQFAMLRTSEIDIMEEVTPEQVIIAARNPELRMIAQRGAGTQNLLFRVSVKPWDNKALRQALAYAIDRQAMVDVVFNGLASPAQSLIGPANGEWFDQTVQVYNYDTKKAKEKLAEAGYPGGFSFKMPCRTSGKDGQTCEVLQAILVNAGINMEIQPYEWVNYYTDFTARKHHGPVAGNLSARPDPGITLRIFYYTKGSQNAFDYSNREVDRLLDEASGIYDVAKAKSIYHKALTIIAEDAPGVPLAWWDSFYGLRDNVYGFAAVVDKVPRLGNLWLSK